jgi:hypothetical protein
MQDGLVALAWAMGRPPRGAGANPNTNPIFTIQGTPAPPTCSAVSTMATSPNGTGVPVLDSTLFANVTSFGAPGSRSIAATYIGPGTGQLPGFARDSIDKNYVWTFGPWTTKAPKYPSIWNGTTCVVNAIILHTPSGSPGAGASLGTGISKTAPPAPFVLTQGHRIQATTTVPGGLPADFQGQTVATLQAQINKNLGVGVATVISVTYPNATTLVVVEDHCGPTQTTTSPFVTTDGGVTITTNYLDMGLGKCAPPAAPGMSTGEIAAVAGGGAIVLGGLAVLLLG